MSALSLIIIILELYIEVTPMIVKGCSHTHTRTHTHTHTHIHSLVSDCIIIIIISLSESEYNADRTVLSDIYQLGSSLFIDMTPSIA